MANVKSSEDINKITVKPSGESVTYNVRTSNPSNKITANATKDTSVFGIKDNMSEYYAKISENWAHADVIVEGTDFSSKYYAQQSKNYAEQVGDVIGEAKSIVDGFEDLAKGYSDTFTTTANTALSDINSNLDNACIEIETVRDNSVVTIEQTKADSLETLEQATEENKQEVREVVNLIKDDLRDIVNRVGFCLFDTVVKDHVLTYEESKGLAPLGSYVYKNAIAGERYGYPDFYEKCLEEYKDSANQKQYLKSNVTKTGAVVDNQGVLSGFGASNYAYLPKQFDSTKSWEALFKVTTGTITTSAEQFILSTKSGSSTNYSFLVGSSNGKWKLFLSSNGTSWNINNTIIGTTDILSNTTYWIKCGWNESEYYLDYSLDGVSFTQEVIVTSDTPVYMDSSTPVLGNCWNTAYWLGSIDLNESYITINGERWWDSVETVTKNPNGHIFYDISQKDQVDELFNTTGSAWLYGIDQENECIFMPRDNSKIHGKLIESFSEGTSWYRVYSDGWCEQGSTVYISSHGQKVSLLKQFKDVNYLITTSGYTNVSGNITCYSKTVSDFLCYTGDDSSFNAGGIYWVAYGYIAISNPIELEKQTYICVGNQVADTSWVDTVTQVQEGVKDIEDVRKSSIKEIEQTTTSCIQDVEIRGAELRSKMALSMFDTILKDHVLSYEETVGLALQGTYVYKEAIAGERHGYPNFYDRCVKEYKESSNTKQWLKSNITKVGSVVDNEGVLSGFSTANYASLPSTFAPTSNDSWEHVICFETSDDITTTQVIVCNAVAYWGYGVGVVSGKLRIGISSSTSSFNVTENTSLAITANTKYYVKTIFNGSNYTSAYSTDNEQWTEIFSKDSTAKISGGIPRLGLGDSGSGQFLGTININESYININSECWWSGVDTLECKKNPNGHLFYDINKKDKVDNIFATTGMAWLYGVDEKNERIFLPRNVWFDQMSMDDVGKAIEAGLPNITGTIDPWTAHSNASIGTRNATGAFYTLGTGTIISRAETYGGQSRGIGLNASLQSDVYGNSDTVQPNAVKKLLYICVGNTVADTSWVDVVTQVQQGVKDLENTRKDSMATLETTAIDCINAVEHRGAELRSKMALSMFDKIAKDHLLTYEESKGLVLIGNYVYKNAIPGSRYGYTDFYNKCIQEMNESEVLISGEITPLEIASYSATSGWSNIENVFDGKSDTYASCGTDTDYIECTFASTTTLTGVIMNGWWVSSVARSCNIAVYSVAEDGTQTLLGKSSNAENNIASYTASIELENISVTKVRIYLIAGISGNPTTSYKTRVRELMFTGTGSNFIKYYKHSNGHAFYNIENKNIINQFFNNYIWLYGVDTKNERILLPNNSDRYLVENKKPTEDDPSWYNLYSDGWCEQGGRVNGVAYNDATKNVTFILPMKDTTYQAIAMAITDATNDGSWNISTRVAGLTKTQMTVRGGLNASGAYTGLCCWEVRGYADVLSTPTTYTYICVGNTVVENSVTDVVDVTTTDNDTTPLFTGMYFDFTPNNVSWLKRGEQSSSGGIYKTCYNELVKVLNGETKYGSLKVIDVTNMVSGTDYSLYWKVNQDTMTFTAPSTAGLFPNNRILVAKKEATDNDSTWYNWYSDGWCEQGGSITSGSGWRTISFIKQFKDLPNITTSCSDNGSKDSCATSLSINSITTSNFQCALCWASNSQWGYITATEYTRASWQACGYTEIPDVSDYTENVNLYFKVANAVQNLELLDAGEVMEALNSKAHKNDLQPLKTAYIVETYSNSTSWYRVYSDGWCEQGGATTARDVTVTFLKPFIGNYDIVANTIYASFGSDYELGIMKVSSSQARLYIDYGGTYTANSGTNWRACGYIA